MTDRLKRYMSPFQWAEVTAIIAFTVYFALTNGTDPWWYILIDSLAAVCGVFCVVLCAGGKKSQYYWGFVNIIAYIVIALINKYYGEVMLNALYYLPTQFVGLYAWGRHYKKQEDQVVGKRMNINLIAIWSVCSAAGVFLYKLLLDKLGGNATLIFDLLSSAVPPLIYFLAKDFFPLSLFFPFRVLDVFPECFHAFLIILKGFGDARHDIMTTGRKGFEPFPPGSKPDVRPIH